MKIAKYLEQSPVFVVNAVYEAMIPNLNKALKKEGVNLLQGLTLTALFFEDKNDITPSQLARQFQTSKGNMSHILSYLEYKGWVRRVLDPKDARKFYIELKPEGRKRALSLIKKYDAIQEHFEKELGLGLCLKTCTSLLRLRNMGQGLNF